MKLRLISILLTYFVLVPTSSIFAQATTDAAERAASLRLQLLEVQDKEAELQEQLQQLDEDIKPENIERSLAGIGSTRPEELRETRRRQLQIQKDSVATQLGLVATSRAKLESAIAIADAEAYHQSAKGTSSATLDQFLMAPLSSLPKWALLVLTLLPALGITGLVVVIRRLQRSR